MAYWELVGSEEVSVPTRMTCGFDHETRCADSKVRKGSLRSSNNNRRLGHLGGARGRKATMCTNRLLNQRKRLYSTTRRRRQMPSGGTRFDGSSTYGAPGRRATGRGGTSSARMKPFADEEPHEIGFKRGRKRTNVVLHDDFGRTENNVNLL